MYGHARSAFIGFPDLVQVTEIESRVKSLRVHVQGDRYDVEVSGPFAVSEQGTFHSVRSREETQFRCRSAGSPVIVSMQAYNCLVPFLEVAAKPFDLIGMYVGGEQFDGCRQVQYDRVCSVGSMPP